MEHLLNHRLYQALLIGSTLAFSWLGMMVVHEFGHVVHLWFSGGRVDYVVLHPLTISYTHPAVNPHPLFVAWGGAAWGCVLPVSLWLIARRAVPRHAYLAAFWAGQGKVDRHAAVGMAIALTLLVAIEVLMMP